MRFRAVFGVGLPVQLFCQSPEVATKQGGRLRVLLNGCMTTKSRGENKTKQHVQVFRFQKTAPFLFVVVAADRAA